jgi:hypothetical protein
MESLEGGNRIDDEACGSGLGVSFVFGELPGRYPVRRVGNASRPAPVEDHFDDVVSGQGEAQHRARNAAAGMQRGARRD